MKATSSESTKPRSPDGRSAYISDTVYQFLAARDRGENLEVEPFCAQYPGLSPDLRIAIESGLRRLQAIKDARRAELPATTSHSHQSQGMRINGYRIVRVLKAGAQGTVYEAIQESTGRKVAVKVIVGFTKHSVPRFEREAEVLAELAHPGIVGIIDRGRTANDGYFIALELVKGQDLDEWIARAPSGKGGQIQIIRGFMSIAQAVEAAHRRGIVHRDLKPSNILIDEHQQPRIVDFGLAQLVGERRGVAMRDITVTGNIIGSIPWSSPEQASAQSSLICAASDVYSLGVLLYQALTGTFPYPVDGPLFQVTENICKRAPRNPGKICTGKFGRIDEGLSHILLTCLAKHPQKRFATGGELADALEEYLTGTFRLPRRRTRKVVTMSIGVLAIAGLALGYRSFTSDASISATNMPTFVNNVGMEFVQLKPGSFSMGSSPSEFGHNTSEQLHQVTISQAFFIARTETTRAQYLRVMGTLPKGVPNEEFDMPVDRVNWNDAETFCAKLSQLDHHNYQLPTEAEWEYACRGGIASPTIGDELGRVSWFSANSGGEMHPVAQKLPNHWGLYDMRGNVSEWVRDNYSVSLGHADAHDPFVSSDQRRHVIRGGNILDDESRCRPAARYSSFGIDSLPFVGFRVIFR